MFGYIIFKNDLIGIFLKIVFELNVDTLAFIGVSFFQRFEYCQSFFSLEEVYLFGIVDMKDVDFGDELTHVVDDVEHHDTMRRVVKGYKRTIEYLVAFHKNITYTTARTLTDKLNFYISEQIA